MNLVPIENDRYESSLYKIKTNKQVILNSNYATKTALSGGKNTLFRFNIRNIQIEKYGLLKVDSCVMTGTVGTSIYTFRTMNLLYNNRCYFSSDNIGYPVILVGYFGTNNMIYKNNGGGLILLSQNVDYIDIIVSDSISDLNAGITNDINFILTLNLDVLEEYKTDVLAPIPIKK